MEGKFISYLRVSTDEQGKSGLGLEAQRDSVTRYLNGGNWTLVKEIQEVASGKNSDRVGLARAKRLCRLHGATLVVAKLDRIARDVAFIADLLKSDVKFVIADMPSADKTMLQMLAVFAEYEADAISARTKAALSAKKRQGYQLGGLRSNSATMGEIGRPVAIQAIKAKADKRAADLLPLIDEIKTEIEASGETVTFQRIADSLNTAGVKTARGCEWTPIQVQRVLSRAA